MEPTAWEDDTPEKYRDRKRKLKEEDRSLKCREEEDRRLFQK